MNDISQAVLCALLEQLHHEEKIPHQLYEQAKVRILGTLDLPEFFCYDVDDGKEACHGST